MEAVGMIFTIIVFCIVFAGMVYFAGVGLLILAGITLVAGWIPILIVFEDPSLSVSFSGSFVEAWSAWAMLEYVAVVVGYIFVWANVSNGGDLPNGLKVIAWMLPHPASQVVKKGTQRSLTDDVNLGALERTTRFRPTTIIGQKIQANQSKKLAKDLEAEKEWLSETSKLTDTALETEKKRVRAQELRAPKRRFTK